MSSFSSSSRPKLTRKAPLQNDTDDANNNPSSGDAASPSLENTLNETDREEFERQLRQEANEKAENESQHHQRRPASQSIIMANAFSLSVTYVTSTSIFVPEISIAASTTISSTSTLLNELSSEDAPDQSLAKIVGATSAAGSGLMIHIVKCDLTSLFIAASSSLFSSLESPSHNNSNSNSNKSNASSSNLSQYLNRYKKNQVLLLALLDEEEATSRSQSGVSSLGGGGGVSPERLEKRITSIRTYVKTLRFLPDEFERFQQQISLSLMNGAVKEEGADFQRTSELGMIFQMVEALSSSDSHLAAIAGVMVGKLPKMKIQRFDEGSSFIKVLVR